MADIQLYLSSVSGNLQIKKQQTQIQSILESKQIPFETFDVASDEEAKERMKKASGKALIPQIFVKGQYKGGYQEFSEANENGELNEFFELSNKVF